MAATLANLAASARDTWRIVSLLAAALAGTGAQADAVPLREFGLLREGMSEAEVLVRLGPYDHEAVYFDHYAVVRKVWYYIPDGTYSGDWITEITFDARGRVRKLDRYRPRP